MAIAPLQISQPQAFSGGIDFSPLANLGQIYKKAQNEQRLSDLGSQLAAGTIDYRTAAGQVANMGDITHTLQFLALAEQQKKQQQEIDAGKQFGLTLANLYGANPTPTAAVPSPSPSPGSPSGPIASPVSAGAPVPSSARVVGDAEGVSSGIYNPPAAPGLRPPVQVADSSAPTRSTANNSAGLPAISPRALALIGAAGNPRLPEAQRETAKVLLTNELDSSKATSDMKEWAFAKAQDPATPDFTTWVRANKAAGRNEVTIDQRGEQELSKTLGKGVGERINDIAKEGDTARTDLALVGQLRDLGSVIKTGAPAAIQGALANYGIKVGDNVGSVEAYNSIVDKLTPSQRVPGTGASSDLDVKMFKSSLPRLINTPEGNQIIENTLAGLAQYKLERASIAEKAQTGELSAKDAIKQMRELANPYENFKQFAKSGFRADPNNPESTGANFSDRFNASSRSGVPSQAPRQAPDGNYYIPDPNRPGKYLQVIQ